MKMIGKGGSSSKAILFVVLANAFLGLQLVSADGKRSYGESCSVGAHISSFFATERDDRTCASGLVCAGRCVCGLGRVWESSATIFGKPADSNDPGCFRAAGAPCYSRGEDSSPSQTCVFNGHCEFGFCVCNAGFRARRGHCVKVDESEASSGDDSSSSEQQGNKQNGLSNFFNKISSFFQRPSRFPSPSSESKPTSTNNEDLDASRFPITRPLHDELERPFPITRPYPEELERPIPISRPYPDDYYNQFNDNFPISRPYPDDSFYNTRPLHEELLRPPQSGSKVLFPDE